MQLLFWFIFIIGSTNCSLEALDESKELSQISEESYDREQLDELLDSMAISEEEIPEPIYEQPSKATIFMRKIGLSLLFTLINLKEWCLRRIKGCYHMIKTLRYTL